MGGSQTRRFKMREKIGSIGDDYWIEDENGDKVFKVDGKVMNVRDTFKLEDRHGTELAKIQERKMSVRDKMAVERDGKTLASVRKGFRGIFRDRFIIDIENGPDLKAKGKMVKHEYKIRRDGDVIAKVSKKWFRFRDTYGVEIDAGEDIPLILALTVAIDKLSFRRG